VSETPAVAPETLAAILAALAAATGPLHLPELSAAAGIEERDAQAAIQHLRRAEIAPVCSSGEGYWLARTVGELRADIERGDRRIRTMLATRSGQRRLLRRLEAERREVVELLSLWGETGAAA
jgi:hypothetical protein